MFIYNAQAAALGGSIRRPVQRVIDVQAASSLPAVGGQQTNRTGRYEIPGVLSIESAYTQVSGSFDKNGNAYNTQATAVVEGLRVQEVVTADRIVAQYASVYKVGAEEPEIRPLGSQFVNLRINGVLVDPKLDVDLHSKHCTFGGLRKQYTEDADLRARMDRVNLWKIDPAVLPDQLRHLPFAQRGACDYPESGVVACSLLAEELSIPGAKTMGHMIYIEGFGRIYVAEYFIQKKTRRLSMLRFSLGSPVEGDLSTAELEGNGVPIP